MNKKAVLSIFLACAMLCANQFVVAQAAGPGQKPHDDRREEKKAPPRSNAPQGKHGAPQAHGQPPKGHPGQPPAHHGQPSKGHPGHPPQAHHGQPPRAHPGPGDRAHHDYRRPPVPHGYHHNRYNFSDSWHARHGHIRPGYVMPRHYYDRRANYVIHDWRGRGLYAPPPGHHWLGVDGNYVLASRDSGVVAHVLLAR